MAATVTQIPTTQFPVDKEIELKIRIRIASSEDYDYFFSNNNELQVGFLADLYDMLDMINKHIVTINNLTYGEIHKILYE